LLTDCIVTIGIVDFLQDWTTRKKVERAGKIYLFGQEAEGTSVMHPDPYKTRFQNKMDEIFDLELLESRRRTRLKNKFKSGVNSIIQDKKRLSGRAIAPAGTTLNKNKFSLKKNSKDSDGMASVGFVDDHMQSASSEEVSFAPSSTTGTALAATAAVADGKKGKKSLIKKGIFQEFTDVDI
jgi:hypothetical protein